MKKIIFVIIGIVVLFILAMGIFNFVSQSSKIDLKVGFNIDSVNKAPIMVAYVLGLFDAQGLKVELIPLESGKGVQQALAMGKIDIGSAGATNFFIPISKGAPVKIISFSTDSPTQIFVRPDANIKEFKDLVGKKIASRIGSSSNLAFKYALTQENIDSNSLEFLDIDSTYAPIALMDKKIVDVAVAGDYQEPIFKKAGAQIFEDWAKKDYTNMLFPRSVIVVNTHFLDSNPKKVELFIKAFIEAQKTIKNNPDKSAEIIAEFITKESAGAASFSKEDVIKSWKTVKYSLWQNPNLLVDLSKIAKEIGDVKEDLTLEQIFDLRFEEVLKNAQAEIYTVKN